nr:beta-defensin 12-like [Manis javanica]
MAPSRTVLGFFVAFFFIWAQFPSGKWKQCGLTGQIASLSAVDNPRDGVYLVLKTPVAFGLFPASGVPGEAQQQRFLGVGDFAACAPCQLGRGKCRRTCAEDEKAVGRCRLSLFCCAPRVR